MNLKSIPQNLLDWMGGLSKDEQAVVEQCIGRGARSKNEIELMLLEIERDAAMKNAGDYFDPTRLMNGRRHEKQIEAIKLSAVKSLIFILAGNRTGKSIMGAFVTMCHLTGVYPDWYKTIGGYQFTYPIKAYANATSRSKQLEVVQPLLIGQPGRWGIGSMIPADRIRRVRPLRGVPDAVDLVEVGWGRSGHEGTSSLYIKSYEQGRLAFESSLIDWIWNDEEPPWDIYEEEMMRLFGNQYRSGGRMMNTFTPLKGLSKVCRMALYNDSDSELSAGVNSQDIGVVRMSWEDNPYLPASEIERMIANTPERERQAREHGIPIVGESAIIDLPRSDYTEDWFEIPREWPFGAGLDHGWDHPTGIGWQALDPMNDITHIYKEWKRSQAELEVVKAVLQSENDGHAYNIFADPSGKARQQALKGRSLMDVYADIGIYMFPAERNIEVGVMDMVVGLRNGTLKVFKTCTRLLEEMNLYHRKENGQITEDFDDLIDANRYGYTNRYAFGFRHGVKPLHMGRRSQAGREPGSWKTRI
jgi:phage terminase large subunit-like protein